MGIYSYELYSQYDVESIIRIGSAGAYVSDLKLYDVVLADSAWSRSSFALSQNGCTDDIMYPSRELNDKIISAAKRVDIPLVQTRIHSSDVFYAEGSVDSYETLYKKHKCTCVEMESFALFHNAKVLGKHAACLLTISDSFTSKEETTAQERQTAFTNMMKIALEACL